MNMIDHGENTLPFASLEFKQLSPSLVDWRQLLTDWETEWSGPDTLFRPSGASQGVGVRVASEDRTVSLVAMRDNKGASLTVEHVHVALRLLDALPTTERAKLHWTFSGVEVEQHDAPGLLSRWSETSEPPVLSIIALNLDGEFDDDFIHLTRGLPPFAGHELAIAFESQSESRHAAGVLAKVSRHVLMHGPVVPGTRFSEPGGGQFVASSMGRRSDAIVMLNQLLQ